jgi:poly-beta-1,6 N-acetyl-D-glucosamine synthase
LSRQPRHAAPRAHWLVLGVVLAATAVAMVAQGYRNNALGRSGTSPAGVPRVGTVLASGHPGPVLDLTGATPRTTGAGPREVALTFDDGPDPAATPQILAVLKAEQVPATFFVVGSRVLSHPGLVREEVAAGNEVGSHTFTHVDPAEVSGWRVNLELSLTQVALAGAAGVHTSLFRPPYSSEPSAANPAQLVAWQAIARRGYTIVLADRDSEDWRRPGVARIVDNATPGGGAGAVILFHDGGGNRSETVTALRTVIDRLRSQHYRFVPVSDLMGTPRAAVLPPASTASRAQGRATILAARLSEDLLRLLTFLAAPVLLLTVVRALFLGFAARRHARRPLGRLMPVGAGGGVSVLVPAYNEELGIAAAVRTLSESEYPDVEVIVVDDGSTDATARVVEGLALTNVTLVRQTNRGKAGALNTGLDHARHDLIVTVDGDTVFAPDTIGWLVRSFADPDVGAISGNTKVGNRRGLLGRWQHIEYVMGFNLDRRMYELLNCMPTVPGAIGAFRRRALDQVGGFSDDTLAEDTDLTIAVNRAGWRVVYEERALAWTEAPSSLGDLWKQRYRWAYGTMQAMWKHRRALRRSETSAVGRRAFPYLLFFQVLLPLLAPVIDVFALYGVVFLRPWTVVGYWMAFNALQAALGVLAFRLDREPLRPLWAMPLQQFVYRQLMYLVVIQSVVTAAVGARLRWHKPARTGEATGAAEAGAAS